MAKINGGLIVFAIVAAAVGGLMFSGLAARRDPAVIAAIAAQERAKAAIDKVELTSRMTHRPNELSGGQRQRVAIARALVNNPSILLADEPTGNLDSKTGAEIMHLFERLHKAGNTIIIVTHEADVASFAYRTVYIRDGQVENDVRRAA